MDIVTILRGILGILLIVGIAFLFSNNKRKVNWRLVVIGLGIQLIFAVFIIHGKTMGKWFFLLGWPKIGIEWLGGAVIKLLTFIGKGSEFVFGALSFAPGQEGSLGFFFAFNVLPTIIFFAAHPGNTIPQ